MPPRFLSPDPYRDARTARGLETFCVVREPLDRALSEFKMVGRKSDEVGSAAEANACVRARARCELRARRASSRVFEVCSARALGG